MSPEPLRRLADGTVKQLNPFTGTEVWTVPGRAHRPISHAPVAVSTVDTATDASRLCTFCTGRMFETTPEKARLVRDGDARTVLEEVRASDLYATTPAFRLFGNLFEIVSLDYWKANHGFRIPQHAARHRASYLADPAGREHVRALVRTRLYAAGADPAEADAYGIPELAAASESFFGGSHEVVVAGRHLVDGARRSDELASSGALTPDDHADFLSFTTRAAERLHRDNPAAAYVSVFQNWLAPAGASFEHLHKQLVAIDEVPAKAEHELTALARDPDLYNRLGVDHAADNGLVVAENDHAVAVAGVGHRYPALVVYSKSEAGLPWEHSDIEHRGVSDLLHACHAATGDLVPSNEEWHYQPVGVTTAMPWRIVLKWRISNPAGFEGATGIFVNTIDPHSLRDRVVPELRELRARGRIAPVRIGGECTISRGALRYLSDRVTC